MMPAWLLTLLKYVPGLSGILDKMSGGAFSKAEELRAQADLDDIQGFHRTGRVSAAHLWKYVKVGLAAVLALVFCASILCPDAAQNVGTLVQGLLEALDQVLRLEF
ncbi:MAG: hypothetical protein IJU37_09780 [Desulfovibrio sp.]|nr:hypothetical protein [Desulfovibrio sp.]